ncbi:hypothetical protein D3C80_1567280 [compost metagenome]
MPCSHHREVLAFDGSTFSRELPSTAPQYRDGSGRLRYAICDRRKGNTRLWIADDHALHGAHPCYCVVGLWLFDIAAGGEAQDWRQNIERQSIFPPDVPALIDAPPPTL